MRVLTAMTLGVYRGRHSRFGSRLANLPCAVATRVLLRPVVVPGAGQAPRERSPHYARLSVDGTTLWTDKQSLLDSFLRGHGARFDEEPAQRGHRQAATAASAMGADVGAHVTSSARYESENPKRSGTTPGRWAITRYLGTSRPAAATVTATRVMARHFNGDGIRLRRCRVKYAQDTAGLRPNRPGLAH